MNTNIIASFVRKTLNPSDSNADAMKIDSRLIFCVQFYIINYCLAVFSLPFQIAFNNLCQEFIEFHAAFVLRMGST